MAFPYLCPTPNFAPSGRVNISKISTLIAGVVGPPIFHTIVWLPTKLVHFSFFTSDQIEITYVLQDPDHYSGDCSIAPCIRIAEKFPLCWVHVHFNHCFPGYRTFGWIPQHASTSAAETSCVCHSRNGQNYTVPDGSYVGHAKTATSLASSDVQ